MEAVSIKPFNHGAQRTALVSTNRLHLLGWQPIIAILAANSKDCLLIGQFLVCSAISQPIRGDKVGALVRQKCCLRVIYPSR